MCDKLKFVEVQTRKLLTNLEGVLSGGEGEVVGVAGPIDLVEVLSSGDKARKCGSVENRRVVHGVGVAVVQQRGQVVLHDELGKSGDIGRLEGVVQSRRNAVLGPLLMSHRVEGPCGGINEAGSDEIGGVHVRLSDGGLDDVVGQRAKGRVGERDRCDGSGYGRYDGSITYKVMAKYVATKQHRCPW